MYWLDVVILTVLGFATVWGLFTGFLWQVSRIVALVLGVYCSISFSGPTTQLLQQYILPDVSPAVVGLISYVAVFLLVCVALFLLTALLDKAVKKAHLQWLNRTLGAVLGLLKAGLLVGLILLGVSYVPGSKGVFEQSRLAVPLTESFRLALAALPDNYRPTFTAPQEAEKQTQPVLNRPGLPPVEVTPPLTNQGTQARPGPELRPEPPPQPRPLTVQEEARRIAEELLKMRAEPPTPR